MKIRILLTIWLAFLPFSPVLGQRGDREGHEMTEVWRDMNMPPAPPLSPEEAIKTLIVKPGFRVQLVASEPMVEDPVAMTWDADGRLWVAEMRGYMPNVDGTGEETLRNGRITVLEDLDGDGRMDKSTRFLEELILPRSIAIVEGGVLVAEPPNLWFCRDTDGDLVCDEKTKVADYAQVEPIETTENALMLAIDNWMYNARSDRRFQFRDGRLIEDQTIDRGQWGIAQDNYGRLYYNSNSVPIMVDLLPSDYFDPRDRISSRAALGVSIGDLAVFPARVTPGVNRGYLPGFLRPDGTLAAFTGASSLTVYRGDYYPAEFVGNVFIPEPTGNLVKRQIVTESADGIELTARNAYADSEFLASTDERFRPVNAYNGPDGCLYIVDMYRGIIQHKLYVTTFLRKQILERGLDKPLGLGRIWRIVRDDADPGSARPNLSTASSTQLVETLSHSNGWHRDTAQRLLVERRDTSVSPALRKVAIGDADPLGRIHALWTLRGMGALDRATARAALDDPDRKVRIATMRAAEPLLSGSSGDPLLTKLIDLTRSDDPSVRTQAILSLAAAPNRDAVDPLLLGLLRQSPDDQYVRLTVLNAMRGRELAVIEHLLASWTSAGSDRRRLLSDAAQRVYASRRAADIARLLDLIQTAMNRSEWAPAALLDGLAAVVDSSKGKTIRSVKLAAKPTLLNALAAGGNGQSSSYADAIGKLVQWPGDQADASVAEPAPLNADQQRQFALGRGMYQVVCMSCHQPHGRGNPGMAPSLIDSPWVNGSPQRFTRIILHGMMGPVEVDGQVWNLIMPGHKENPIMTDARIAAIMTYLRREWGHTADPVDEETVATVREETEDRELPWTVEELLKIP